jgi:hypothetical protein
MLTLVGVAMIIAALARDQLLPPVPVRERRAA